MEVGSTHPSPLSGKRRRDPIPIRLAHSKQNFFFFLMPFVLKPRKVTTVCQPREAKCGTVPLVWHEEQPMWILCSCLRSNRLSFPSSLQQKSEL